MATLWPTFGGGECARYTTKAAEIVAHIWALRYVTTRPPPPTTTQATSPAGDQWRTALRHHLLSFIIICLLFFFKLIFKILIYFRFLKIFILFLNLFVLIFIFFFFKQWNSIFWHFKTKITFISIWLFFFFFRKYFLYGRQWELHLNWISEWNYFKKSILLCAYLFSSWGLGILLARPMNQFAPINNGAIVID